MGSGRRLPRRIWGMYGGAEESARGEARRPGPPAASGRGSRPRIVRAALNPPSDTTPAP